MTDQRREPDGPQITPTQPSMPESKKTTQLAAVPDWAIELSRSVRDGFAATDKHFEQQDKVLARLADESVSTTNRLGKVEATITDLGGRLVLVEGRADNTSLRVRGVSVSDEGQNMQISSLALKVDALSEDHSKLTKETAKQTVMLKAITDLLEKPLVRKLGYAAGALLLAGLTSATGYLARGNVQTPQPTIIQVAPAAAVDGGHP